MSDQTDIQETVTLTIDGSEVVVPKGTTLLDAAASAGTKVPHYCYHPGLSSPAMCRLCLVEVEGAPKLQPSCVTAAQDGQVVHTESDKACQMRQGVLEFYLVNHPLDCPICDQSGECKLQDYVHAEGRKHGRSKEPKRVFGRDDFGGDVLFYGDRCVMCTRCVRFMNEVAQDPQLTVVERGSRSVIDTFFDRGLDDSTFGSNIVDICPVGALVSKDFLHKQRAWDLDHTPSICPNCSQGCNIELHTRDNRVQRMKPRENQAVNGYWMCDYGRSNYEWINGGERIETPRYRAEDGMWVGAGWTDVLERLAVRMSEEPAAVAAVGSPFASLEDLGMLSLLVDALGGGTKLFRSRRVDTEDALPGFPTLVRRKDLAPNVDGAGLLHFDRVGGDDARGGLDALSASGGVLFVLGDDLDDVPEDFGSSADLFVYLGTHPSDAARRHADFILPITTFAEQEGSFCNVQGRVQRFRPAIRAIGAARPAWMILGALHALKTEGTAPTQAGQAFERVASETPALTGISYPLLGTRGAHVNEPAGLMPGGEG